MDTTGFIKKSEEVLVCTDEIIGLSEKIFPLLREMAIKSPKKRARICAHKTSDSLIQEMIILINQDSYIRPHRHLNKCESFHVIEGNADIVVFENDGTIKKVIPFSRDTCFYYRLDSDFFHTIIVRSRSILFHEVTNGPFVDDLTEFASFSPNENDSSISLFNTNLNNKINEWKLRHAT
jgi:hypothetical protein